MTAHEDQELGPLLEVARALAAGFARRADAYDRAGAFPTEDFEELKRAGFLGLLVPKAYGGMGLNFYQYTRLIAELARGNAATALAFNMHCIIVGGLAEVPEDVLPSAQLRFVRWVYSEAVSNRRVFASSSSEPQSGTDFSATRTTYERTQTGYVLRGVKAFVSMAGHADYYVILARAEPAGPRPKLSYFVVDRDAPGLRVEEVWDTLGMRSTSSNNLHLTDCEVPTERLFLQLEGFALNKILQEPHWLVAGYNGVYLGVAEAALDFAAAYLRAPKSNGAPAAAESPLVQHRLGELSVALEGVRLITYDAARRVVQDRGSSATNAAIYRAKYAVAELAPWLTSHAIRLCGGSTLSRRFPLERLYRDARCGGLMFAKSDECLTQVGRALLAAPPLAKTS